jgi:hypothetical protein
MNETHWLEPLVAAFILTSIIVLAILKSRPPAV